VATTLLISEATKLTLGKDLTVYTPHNVMGLLECKRSLWLSNSRFLQYKALLLVGPAIQIRTFSSLNPATFLPEIEEDIGHDCEPVVLHNYASREEPISDPEITTIMDSRSYVKNGIQRAGYATVTL
jgi:hypothetical protein